MLSFGAPLPRSRMRPHCALPASIHTQADSVRSPPSDAGSAPSLASGGSGAPAPPWAKTMGPPTEHGGSISFCSPLGPPPLSVAAAAAAAAARQRPSLSSASASAVPFAAHRCVLGGGSTQAASSGRPAASSTSRHWPGYARLTSVWLPNASSAQRCPSSASTHASAAMRPLARGVRQSVVVVVPPLPSPKWSDPSAASPTLAHEDVTRATSTPVAFVQEHALAPSTSSTWSATSRA